MNVEIMIVSYLKDKDWLIYNLRSIRKFAQGFSGTTVVVPNQELREFLPLTGSFSIRLKGYDRTDDPRKWHLDAQLQRCLADEHCPNADFMLNTDSDCVFREKVTPEDYFLGGKPILLYQPYYTIHDGRTWWKKCTEEALRVVNVEHEFMCRHPAVHYRNIYPMLRSHVEMRHRLDFDEFMLSRKADYPWGVSEFNLLGAYAWYSSAWRRRYHWIDVEKEGRPHDKLVQFWSHAPPTQMHDTWLEGKQIHIHPTQYAEQLGI